MEILLDRTMRSIAPPLEAAFHQKSARCMPYTRCRAAPAARDLQYLHMSKATFKANAYVKEGCPFSFKYLVFMTEAGLLDDLNIVRLREGEAGFDATKQRLSEHLGKPVSFPTVEIEPGRYMTDSDRLIEHYAEQHRLVPDELPVLSLYKQTIFPKLIELHKLKSGKA
jgi:hypothetical protein